MKLSAAKKQALLLMAFLVFFISVLRASGPGEENFAICYLSSMGIILTIVALVILSALTINRMIKDFKKKRAPDWFTKVANGVLWFFKDSN